jgi:hypothetical protein
MKSIVELKETLPIVFPRKDVGRLTGGIVHPRTCANLDSLGLGPDDRFRVGKIVCYTREAFIVWLGKRIKKIQTNSNNN